jgi:shikimate dehydrogenase
MKLYGLIGKPLKHSFSKAYFTEKFRSEGIVDCRYENFELEAITQLPTILKAHAGLRGLNVTIPYKKEVLQYLHSKNEVVVATGACNCIKIVGGELYGYNTDVPGFQKSLQSYLKPHHQKALVLGTGGSSGAVQFALKQSGIPYKLVSRHKSEQTLAYNEMDAELLEEYTILINTTPLGMFPDMDAAPELPYERLTEKHLLYDLIYNPEKTLFLQRGERRGATIVNGHTMLLLQAEESWTIWNT